MSRSRNPLSSFCSLPALFLAIAIPAQAQLTIPQPPATPQAPSNVVEGVTIRDVRVEGLQRIEPGTVFSYLPIRVNDRVNSRSIADSVRSLFATGFFQDVRVSLDGDVLVVSVEERPAIGAVEILGTKEFDKDTLKKALADSGLAEAQIFDRALLERAEQELKRQYLGRGKYDVQIQSTVTPLPRNRVAISISVDEGDDARIKEIKIVGATAFREKDLLEEFQLTTPTWMSWYTKSDQYSRQKLTGDIETLRSYYLNRGYLEFSIDSTQVSLSADRRDVFITIVINEGDRFVFGEVSLAGDLLGQEALFQKQIQIKPGETFSNERLQAATKSITDRLGELGYAFGAVNPIPQIDREKKKVDFVLQVDPARRVYVRRINISGNAKTRDEVVRREMRQYEASWYDSERIRLSRNRIDRLGYFKQVEIETESVPGTTDQVDVNVKLEERPLGSLTLGVGFSSSENLVLSGSISQQNFMGTGTNVSLEVNTGKVSQVFAISHLDPYWTDDGVSRSIDVYARTFNADELDSLGSYKIKSQGVGVRFGIPYTEEDRLFLGLSYDDSKITGAAPENFTPGDSIVLSAGWSRDSRDSALAPTTGVYQYANLDYGVPGGDLEYLRLTYGHQRFTPLTKAVTFVLNTELGYGIGLSGQSYPRIKNFYVGGIGSVRGFSSSSIGEKIRRSPLAAETDLIAIGGSRKLVLNGELLMPLPGMAQDRTVRVFSFLDAGTAWGDDQKVTLDDMRVSTGFGLSWFSPVGPLKLSWAIPLRKLPGDDTQTIQFQIGTGF